MKIIKTHFRPTALAWFLALSLFMLLPVTAWAAAGTGNIVIFHTNDMHARFSHDDDGGKSIGLAEMAAAVKMVKKETGAVLWLDAGDTLHGMPNINISRGDNAVLLLNQAGLDAMVPGNHDFNYGSSQLVKLSKKMRFPVLSANLVEKNTGQRLFPAYRIFKLPNDIKVAVFALCTPESAYKTNPAIIKGLVFLNPVTVAQNMIKELKPKCDVLVALMHMGVDESSVYTSERIARESPGIDLIIDGHSHTALTAGERVGDTLIVQTGWHEYRLGRVDLQLKEHKLVQDTAKLLTAEDLKAIAPVPDIGVEMTMKKINLRNKKLLGEVVAHSDKQLTSDRVVLRRSESELGNLCADALRWRTKADIAIINGGSMRSDLPVGNVTRADILAIFPFGNTVRVAEVPGKTVREILEHSVYGYPAAFGGFLDVSGLTFSFDPTKPIGSRIGGIWMNGLPLDENRTYTLAAPDFIFSGGDNYVMVKDLPIVGEFDTCESILTDYLNEVGMKGYETGRIILLKNMGLPEYSTEGENQAA